MQAKHAILAVGMLGVWLAAVRLAPAADQTASEAKPATTAGKGSNEAQSTTASTKPVVAVFALNGPITEKPMAEDFPFGSTGGESICDLITRMKKARDDAAVKAIVILLGRTALGTAQMEEIRHVMDQIKASGKQVHAHVDSLSTPALVLLSGASQLSMVPTGDCIITGIYGEQLYLRGLLDKIGVVPDFLTCGQYKSAAEMFMRTGPSPAAEQMVSWLLDGIYETYVTLIAQGRGVPTEKVRGWIDLGLYTAEQAKAAGIIDVVQQRQDFVADLKKQYGSQLVFDQRYGKKKQPDLDFSSPLGVLKLWAELLQGPKAKRSRKGAVAVVYVDGPIVPGKASPSPFGSDGIAYSTTIRKALDEAASDESIKALVLRIDSPGGSAVASEIILDATRRVKAAKPFVVSMGNVAGSGGYYVACAADTIFADRSTITGSIGVVGGKMATAEMWANLGIHWRPVKRGKNAALLSSMAVFTEDERKQVQGWMDEIYTVFKRHVQAIRGDRLKKPLDEVAGGRVYTGGQALELGLVDRIGGLDQAIGYVAQQAKLEEGDYVVRVLPKPKRFIELLLSDLKDGDGDDKTLSLRALGGPAAPARALLDVALPLIDGLPARRVNAIKTALRQLQTLTTERTALMMPEMMLLD